MPKKLPQPQGKMCCFIRQSSWKSWHFAELCFSRLNDQPRLNGLSDNDGTLSFDEEKRQVAVRNLAISALLLLPT